MKVNMTPNPLDVVTIHASQGDTEARQWEFELHNNGELIDTSEITEQLFFKAYKGGTEQILPENTSTPTTSPFKGDIKYPQGLLSDQEFLYRESPAIQDGLARIDKIKGNTLKWNQHVKNGETGSFNLVCTTSDGTMTVSGIATVETEARRDFRASVTDGVIPVGHKILLLGGSSVYRLRLQGTYTYESGSGLILEASSGAEYQIVLNMNIAPNTQYNITIHPQIFDLTQMFGAGNEPSTIEEFKSLFPLYYPYNSGSLIPFMGNGIKTVGKNLFQNNAVNTTLNGITFTINDDKSVTVNGTATGNAGLTRSNGLVVPNIKKGESLIWSGSLNRPVEQAYLQLVYKGDETGQTYSFVSVNGQSVSINATENMTLDGAFLSCRSGNTFNNETFYPMLRYANTDSTFEPYASSTLSLPISTYFPNGMDGVGDAYDELTNSGYAKRFARTTFDGTKSIESIVTIGSYTRFTIAHGLSNVKYPNAQQKSNYLPYVVSFSEESSHFYMNGSTVIIIMPTSLVGSTRETANAYLQSNPLTIAYELATPTETSFTTASLVTENVEIPLSNEDGTLIGKCTEQLSSESGFIDAKIKLADEDGECYSNKIQLHIERSPQ